MKEARETSRPTGNDEPRSTAVSREPGVILQPGCIGGPIHISQSVQIEKSRTYENPTVSMQDINGEGRTG